MQTNRLIMVVLLCFLASIKMDSQKKFSIAIIEPLVYKNIPATKNLIINSLKEQIGNKYTCEVIVNDTLAVNLLQDDTCFFFEFIRQRTEFDLFLVVFQGYKKIYYYQQYYPYVYTDTAGEFDYLLFDRNAKLAIRYRKNSYNNSYGNILKYHKRLTQSASKAIIRKIDSM